MKKYYEAYEERYKTAHARGVSWAGEAATPIVLETLRRYGVALLISAQKFADCVDFIDGEALARFPGNAMLLAFKGMALMRMNRNDEAGEALAEADREEADFISPANVAFLRKKFAKCIDKGADG